MQDFRLRMTYYVSSGTLNPKHTHSHSLSQYAGFYVHNFPILTVAFYTVDYNILITVCHLNFWIHSSILN